GVVVDDNGLARGKVRDVRHLDVSGTRTRGCGQSGGRLDEPRGVLSVVGLTRVDYLADIATVVAISSRAGIAPRFRSPVVLAIIAAACEVTPHGGGDGHAHPTVCGNRGVDVRRESDGCAAA